MQIASICLIIMFVYVYIPCFMLKFLSFVSYPSPDVLGLIV